MFPITLFTILTFVSFGLVASAPVAVPLPIINIIKRDNAAIQQIFTNLKSSTDAILPQIRHLATSGSASDDTVTPLVNQLTAALDQATSSLSTLSPSSSRKKQTEDDVANLVVELTDEITTTFSNLNAVATRVPALESLLPRVYISLDRVLRDVELALHGVLYRVENLANDLLLLEAMALGLRVRPGIP